MEILECLIELHYMCLDLSKKITFKKNKLNFTLLAIYGSLIELTGCIITLSETHRIGIPIIFRSVLEAFVDLSNLIKDENYGYYLAFNDNEQWLKMLHEAKKGSNPYFKYYTKIPNMDEVVKEYERNYKNLRKDGYNKLTIKQKFEKADLLDLYYSVYPYLCSHSHGNIGTLIRRHADIDKSRLDYELVYYNNEPLENYMAEFSSISSTILKASVMIHEFFKTGLEKNFVNMAIKFNKISDKKI